MRRWLAQPGRGFLAPRPCLGQTQTMAIRHTKQENKNVLVLSSILIDAPPAEIEEVCQKQWENMLGYAITHGISPNILPENVRRG